MLSRRLNRMFLTRDNSKFDAHKFSAAQRVEKDYLRSLRQVAKQVDHIVKGMAPSGRVPNAAELQEVLRRYSELLKPWSKSVANRMVEQVAVRNRRSWEAMGKSMGRELRKEITEAPIGLMLQELRDAQVVLITSLPIEAGERVQKLVLEAQVESSRADEIAASILATGDVTLSRAKLIARTEVARASSELTMVRAKHVGSEAYVWRTSEDADVRESHKHMNGKICRYDQPPEVEPGKFYHAGTFPNCRCWPEPIITDD